MTARNVTASFLVRMAGAGPLVIPRVNSRDTGLMEDDPEAVVGPRTFGESVGKVQSVADIHHITSLIDRLEDRTGLEHRRVKLVPWIETASAILNTYEICSASPRVFAVAFGAEDFTRDMEMEHTQDDSEIAYPRSSVYIASRSAGVLALDKPVLQLSGPPRPEVDLRPIPTTRVPGQVRDLSGPDRHHPRPLLAVSRGDRAGQARGRRVRRG